MRHRIRYWLTALLTGITFLLAGCSVSGTVEVRSADQVAVDLVFSDLPRYGCRSLDDGMANVTASPTTDSRGQRVCHVRGTVQVSELRGVHVARTDDYLVVTAVPASSGGWGGSVDVRLVLPGRVLSSSQGTVSGNVVHLNGDSLSGGDLSIVARTAPEAPGWALAAGIGALVGALAVLALRKRRESAAAPLEESEPPDPGALGAVAAEPAGTDDRAAVNEPADNTYWSRPEPPASGAAPQVGGLRPAPDADHSVWAPPDDTRAGPERAWR